ncbi:MAG: hypothetical protein PHO33_02215 [Clostridia bacterium]|nr:hypothetical protein [Clostridia bacterium]
MKINYSLNHKLSNTIIFMDYSSPFLNHTNSGSLVNYNIEGKIKQEYSTILLPALPIARIICMSNKFALLAFTYANWNGYVHTNVEAIEIEKLINFVFLSDLINDMQKSGAILLSEEELFSTEKRNGHLFINTDYGLKDVTPQSILFTNYNIALVAPALNGKANLNQIYITKNKKINGHSPIILEQSKYTVEQVNNLTLENCLNNIFDNTRLFNNNYIKSLVKKTSEYNYNNEEKTKFLYIAYEKLAKQKHEESMIL